MTGPKYFVLSVAEFGWTTMLLDTMVVCCRLFVSIFGGVACIVTFILVE